MRDGWRPWMQSSGSAVAGHAAIAAARFGSQPNGPSERYDQAATPTVSDEEFQQVVNPGTGQRMAEHAIEPYPGARSGLRQLGRVESAAVIELQ